MRKFLMGLVGATALTTPALAQTTDNTLGGLLGGAAILPLIVIVGIGALIFWFFFRGGGD